MRKELEVNGIEFYPQKEFDEDLEDKTENDKIRVGYILLWEGKVGRGGHHILFCTSASLPSYIRNKLLFNLYSCGNCSLFPGISIKQSKPVNICTTLWIAESPAPCALETVSFSLCLEISRSPIASPTVLLSRKATPLLHFWLSSYNFSP